MRNLGTVGGNVANGDPANDMPGLMQTLDATYRLAGPDGERTVAAREFYGPPISPRARTMKSDGCQLRRSDRRIRL